jgi:hypothetical protein
MVQQPQFIGLLLLVGTRGQSAQIGLRTELPEAIERPAITGMAQARRRSIFYA